MTDNQIEYEGTKQLLQRLHRIQGQLTALETVVGEGSTCEEIITRTYTIEKALSSFIMQVVNDYLDCHIATLLEDNPQAAQSGIQRLFQLVNRWTFTLLRDDRGY